jgi:N-acetylneuraminic acid mutarotase
VPKWEKITQLNVKFAPGALAHHTATVYNNAVYIIGGIRANGVSNTEMYKFDIYNLKWEHTRQRDHMPEQRDDHTCNLYEDSMLLFGGYKNGVRTNELLSFKFEGSKWSELVANKPPCPRAGHSAVLSGSNLIICAGTNEQNVRLNDTWIYSITQNTWAHLKTTGFFPSRNGHSSIMLHDTHMVVFGGISEVTRELDDLYCLDTKKGTWSQWF